jgi:uncharacterized protein YkwD
MTFSPAPESSQAARFEFRRFAVALAIAFAATAGGLLASAGPTYAWDASSFNSSSERQLVSLTNQARASHGLKALKTDPTLTSVARWRSKDMIVKDYFSHNIPPSGKMVFSTLDSKGFCYSVAGENIGWTDDADGSATNTIQSMFMNSSGHRANILGKSWDVIGVGAYKGTGGKKMWTVLFANKCGSTAPAPKPTVKPHPKPTVKPAAPRATPRPTAKPTPAPTPVPTPTSTPTALPEPTDPSGFGAGLAGRLGPIVGGGDTAEAASGGNKSASTGPTSMRVVDESAPPGLFETIVGDVTGFFLGG